MSRERLPSRPLAIVVGNERGRSLRLKHDGQRVDEFDARPKRDRRGETSTRLQATVLEWSRAAIVEGEKAASAGTAAEYMYREIRPAARFQVLKRPGWPFYVAGWFELVHQVRGERSANEAFRAFDPASEGTPPNVAPLGRPEKMLDEIAAGQDGGHELGP